MWAIYALFSRQVIIAHKSVKILCRKKTEHVEFTGEFWLYILHEKISRVFLFVGSKVEKEGQSALDQVFELYSTLFVS